MIRIRAILVCLCWHGECVSEDLGSSIVVTAGATFGEPNAQIALAEARVNLTNELFASAGIGYFTAEGDYQEWQFRALATAQFSLGNWIVDDRNLISLSSESVERYRNRLRAISPPILGRHKLSLQFYDEIFFDFDRNRIVRNNIAIGFGAAFGASWRFELYQVWSDNYQADDTRFILAIISVTFPY